MVEHYFTCIIWEMLGDYSTGMAITGGMGNQSKTNVILRLAEDILKDNDVLKRLESACKAFNVLRENRNILMHSHSVYITPNNSKPIWTRATGKGKDAHARVEADFQDLERIIAEICELGKYSTELFPFLHARRGQTADESSPILPEVIALPVHLKAVPFD